MNQIKGDNSPFICYYILFQIKLPKSKSTALSTVKWCVRCEQTTNMCCVSNLRNCNPSFFFRPQMTGLTHQATEHYPAKTGEYSSNIPRVVFQRSHVLRKIFDGYKTIFVFRHYMLIYPLYRTHFLGGKLHFTNKVHQWVFPPYNLIIRRHSFQKNTARLKCQIQELTLWSLT